MIVRLVKMHFKYDKLEEFLNLYKSRQEAIKNVPGCLSLTLLLHNKMDGIVFTHSTWKNESYLENYRQSNLFKDTWEKTKILFIEKPEAWSTKIYE